jgi:hypothetical protein
MDTPQLTRGLPQETERISAREIELIKYRDDRTYLMIKLVTGEEITGSIRWYDDRALGLIRQDRTETTVHLSAVAYYRPSTT